MSTTTTTKTTSDTKVITGVVRLSYAHIWEAVAIEEGGEKKFSASFIIDKSDKATLKKIEKAIDAAKEAGKTKWGGKVPAKLKLPLRDGDEERPDDDVYEGCYFVNASAKTQPGIVNAKAEKIMNQDEVYSGCYVHASITFYPFDKNGNRGIAAGLNHIMKVKDGEPLGGRSTAESDFAELVTEADDFM